jgi:predicted MPP superfamily phosphohydrolase
MIIIIIFIIILILLSATAFNSDLTIKNHEVTSSKFETDESIRIILIADLHSHIYGENQSALIAKIKDQKPDIILLAGDIAEDEVPINGTKLLLNGIKDICPVFYVSGNHEYWSGDIKNIKEIIRSYGVVVLEDEFYEIDVDGVPIIIAGVDDPEWINYENKDLKPSMDENFKELDEKNQYKILLAHRPELIESYKKYSFDLVVSGHAHGGQIRIPFVLNGLYAPNQGWFPKYAGGIYQHDNLIHIISRGISNNLQIPRIFNPPEIVVVDIK